MKLFVVALIAAFATAACSSSDPGDAQPQTQTRTPPAPHKVWEPEVGVLCDRVEQACYTREGPSIPWTEKFLGKESAEKLDRKIYLAGPSGMKTIDLSDGIVCSYSSRVCRKGKYNTHVAPDHTRVLFGSYY